MIHRIWYLFEKCLFPFMLLFCSQLKWWGINDHRKLWIFLAQKLKQRFKSGSYEELRKSDCVKARDVCVFAYDVGATFLGISHELPVVGCDLVMKAYLIIINQSPLSWIANETQKVLLCYSYWTILKGLWYSYFPYQTLAFCKALISNVWGF